MNAFSVHDHANPLQHDLDPRSRTIFVSFLLGGNLVLRLGGHRLLPSTMATFLPCACFSVSPKPLLPWGLFLALVLVHTQRARSENGGALLGSCACHSLLRSGCRWRVLGPAWVSWTRRMAVAVTSSKEQSASCRPLLPAYSRLNFPSRQPAVKNGSSRPSNWPWPETESPAIGSLRRAIDHCGSDSSSH